jgi:hypothetical protein
MPTACPNCGHRNDSRARFCDACGAYLGWDAGEAPDNQVPPASGRQRDEQTAAVQLRLESDLITVAPGGAESVAFTVRNPGTQVEQFRPVVTGPAWLSAEPATMSVYPGQEGTGTLQAAPPRTPDSAAGIAPFRLTLVSALHPNVASSASGRVDVAPFYELAAELVPTSSSGRGVTRHRLTLDNRGNAPLRIVLHPADVAAGLRVGLPGYADAWPGQVTEVPVLVRAARRWFGRPEAKTFAVTAEAPRPLAATRLAGTRVVSPLLPGWVPPFAGVVAAAAVAAAVVIPRLHPGSGSSHQSSPRASAPAPAVVATTSAATSADSTVATTAAQSAPSPSAPAQSTTAPSTPAESASVSATPPPPPSSPALPSYDLTSLASSAAWTSYSILDKPSVPVQQDAGCQAGAAGLASGAVFSLQQVDLEDGTLASTALETDPPQQEGGYLVGVYTFPATTASEAFRAGVGFCSGVSSTAEMQYTVSVGTGAQQIVAQGTPAASAGQLVSVEATLPVGTTQLELNIGNESATSPVGDVIWVDPRIEAVNASPAPSRPPS